MSDADTPKPNRMSGLIAPKGNAQRPAEPALPPGPKEARPVAMGSKSLTLRLPEPEYERLRAYAFANRTTHQTILAEALKAYLDANT